MLVFCGLVASRVLENPESGVDRYPAMISSRDGKIEVVYSYFVVGAKASNMLR